MRSHLIRTLRAGGVASAFGTFVAIVFYALIEVARFEASTSAATEWRNARFETLPKPEEFGWLVGVLAFAALAMPALDGRWEWPSRLARAACGAIALALPFAMIGAAIETASWVPVALFAAVPLFVAFALTPLPAARRPPPDSVTDAASS